MDGFELLASVAAVCTTCAFVPQLLHTFRTKSVGDLHAGMLVVFDVGLALWLVYGVHLHSWPMILANAVSLGLQLPLLVMKVSYAKRSGKDVG